MDFTLITILAGVISSGFILVIIAEFSYMFSRNAQAHIRSDASAWNDDELVIFDYLYQTYQSYFTLYMVSSFICGTMLLISVSCVPGNNNIANVNSTIQWISGIYLGLLGSVLATTLILNYLRFMYKVKELHKDD